MLSYSKAYYDLKNAILLLYDEGEASAIAHEMMLFITGLDKLKRLGEKDTLFTTKQQQQFDSIKERLLKATPPQHIVGIGWFLGREFNVNEHVLIPRPETEELTQWIIDDAGTNFSGRIIDIGTGSGCIPVSLKLALPNAEVSACDISPSALLVAHSNADKFDAEVMFSHLDFLNVSAREQLGIYDIIVSNPPYIPLTDKHTLHQNVVNHEPHLALFVPGNEPLLFYNAIADFGKTHLSNKGIIYCELDSDHATKAGDMLANEGYTDIKIRKDFSGNTRMLKAIYKK